MILSVRRPLHLTYGLNVHRGEGWGEVRAALEGPVLEARRRVAPGRPFGLGLRLGRRAASELRRGRALADFAAWLRERDLYVFTINGFPYGRFHGGPVKARVYRPDWRARERRDYTVDLARLLAAILPEGVAGSISTVPGALAADLASPADDDLMAARLGEAAAALWRLREETGRDIHLGLEPEPGCRVETTAGFVAFFEEHLLRAGARALARRTGRSRAAAEQVLRRHVGICFDTCHLAVRGERLADSLDRLAAAGARVSKIQLSAALTAGNDARGRAALRRFAEPVYLHQVSARGAGGAQGFWLDLPEALAALERRRDLTRIAAHVHVPLYWRGGGGLGSTARALDAAFWSRVRRGATEHLEIETYTFDVLPPALRRAGLVASIAREFAWARRRAARRVPKRRA
jgi:sugar phosphate isomerase/epimerase